MTKFLDNSTYKVSKYKDLGWVKEAFSYENWHI